MTHFVLASIVMAGAMLPLMVPLGQRSPVASFGDSLAQAAITATHAPAGTEQLAVEWVKISPLDLGTMLAAVARPAGTGPFPTILILHGTHGFAQEYVQIAQALAREGFLAVAPCWFTGGGGAGARFITPIACPDAPPLSAHLSPVAMRTVAALVQAVRRMPDVRIDRVALFGHSRGGGIALTHALQATDVHAVVLNSTGYPDELRDRAAEVKAAILILHGVADNPADGGSEMTAVQRARDFEAALRRAVKRVDATYYDGGSHNGLFASPTQRDDELRRIVAFLRDQQTSSRDPMDGTWDLDVAASRFNPGPGRKSDTRTYKVDGNKIQMTGAVVYEDGRSENISFTAVLDGKDYRASGNPRVETIAQARVDAYTIKTTTKRDGTVAATSTRQVSKDGRTMTITTTGVDNRDVPFDNTLVFRKRDPKPLAHDHQPGQTFRDCADCPEMVVIPAASFDMGAPADEPGRHKIEGPQRRVTIRPFAAGKFHVTRGEWAAFASATKRPTTGGCAWASPSRHKLDPKASWQHLDFPQDDTHPVVCVTWHDAQDFVRWLTTHSGHTYRLLTEAEWEYAARAGTTTPYPWGSHAGHEHANYGADEGFEPLASGHDRWLKTSPVGAFPPNAFGLHDMHGNVMQWVQDCLSKYSNVATDGSAYETVVKLKGPGPFGGDMTGTTSCFYRMLRGGDWGNPPRLIRSASRNYGPGPGATIEVYRSGGAGFRVARTLD